MKMAISAGCSAWPPSLQDCSSGSMMLPSTESMWQLSEGSQDTTDSAVEHTRRISFTCTAHSRVTCEAFKSSG